MNFHIITLLPAVFEAYLKESIIGRARKRGLIKVRLYNLRDFAVSRHKKVDDRSYGGGPGMVIALEPLVKALEAIAKGKRKEKTKVIIFSAAGRQFDNKKAAQLARRYRHLILVAGRYEGIDERFRQICLANGYRVEEISIGPYVLSGGELPALVFIDVLTRQLKGVLGKEESLEERRGGAGIPVYTRPEVFLYRGKKYRVPRVLLSGNHQAIDEWRKSHRKLGKPNN